MISPPLGGKRIPALRCGVWSPIGITASSGTVLVARCWRPLVPGVPYRILIRLRL